MNEEKRKRIGWPAAELKARNPAPESASIKRQKRAAKRSAKAAVARAIARDLKAFLWGVE